MNSKGRSLGWEELPAAIQGIVPKSAFRTAIQVSDKRIAIRVRYDSTVDIWVLQDGRWVYENNG